MKENLTVQEFSLAKIAKNLHRIPTRGKLMEGFGNEEVKKLSAQEKKALMEKISKFNEYGKVLRCETALKELVGTIEEIAKGAETYAMTEASDFFQQEVISRDYKQLGGVTKQFKKLAQECYGKLMELNALYEDSGKILERYFEIKSLDEIAQNVAKDECSDCGCGNPNDDHSLKTPTTECCDEEEQ